MATPPGERMREKNLHCYLDSYCYVLCMRASQGHSEGNKVDPSLHDSAENPYKWIDYICHVGSCHDCSSIVNSGLIARGKDTKEGR